METSSSVRGSVRLITRRGAISVIGSDKVTTSVGLAKEMISCIEKWNRHATVLLAHKGLTWIFFHHSVLIIKVRGKGWPGATKELLWYSGNTKSHCSEEVLITTFCLNEQSLNNRPLTPVTSDPNGNEALTPNQLLLGHRASSFPPLGLKHRKCYAWAKPYANAIWNHSLRENVLKLNKRAKQFFLQTHN